MAVHIFAGNCLGRCSVVVGVLVGFVFGDVCLFVFFGLVFLNSLAISHAVIRAQYHPGIENLRNLCFAIVTFHAKPIANG